MFCGSARQHAACQATLLFGSQEYDYYVAGTFNQPCGDRYKIKYHIMTLLMTLHQRRREKPGLIVEKFKKGYKKALLKGALTLILHGVPTRLGQSLCLFLSALTTKYFFPKFCSISLVLLV